MLKKSLLIVSVLMSLSTSLQSRQKDSHPDSGPKIGEECPAFDPQHAAGPASVRPTLPLCSGSNLSVAIGILFLHSFKNEYTE